jgi:hypothetical protein
VRQAFERRPAPPGLKRKLMERRRTEHRRTFLSVIWQRLAASVVLAVVLCGGWMAHEQEKSARKKRRAGQVLTALRITRPRAQPR